MDTPIAKRDVCDGMLQHLLTRWCRRRPDDFSRCSFFDVIFIINYIVLIINLFNWTDIAPCCSIMQFDLDLLGDLPARIAGINFGSYGARWLPIGYTFATCLINGDISARSAGTWTQRSSKKSLPLVAA